MKILISLMLVLVIACGRETKTKYVVGTPGADGTSCHSEYVNGGVNIVCGEEIAFVPNGQDGKDGLTRTIEYRVVCPDINPTFKQPQALLYVDGSFLSFVSTTKGTNGRLVVLSEMSQYKTSDGRGVMFFIQAGEIVCGAVP